MRLGAAALLTLLAAACETPLEDRILNVGGEGQALVLLFIDNNLNGRFDQNVDTPIPDGVVIVRRTAAPEDSSVIRSDSSGLAFTPFIGVGQYQASVRDILLGDSLLHTAGTDAFTILPADTIGIIVGVSFYRISITEARQSPGGRKAWVRGNLFSPAGIFGDSTMHVGDTLSAIRVTKLQGSPAALGDSLEVLGRIRDRDGQPVVEFESLLVYRGSIPPVPDTVSTSDAAAASGEAGDAELVHVRAVTISDTATTVEGRELTVDDGSGPLIVILDNNINFSPLNVFLPGVSLDLNGVLVPMAGGGGWVLKPRGRGDVTILPPPTPGPPSG